MENVKYRKHPRVYDKNQARHDDRILDISAGTAVGILALAFVTGIFGGYVIKRNIG